jgi:5'-nucleotidase
VRVLITNDDGIDSPGLAALATAVHDAGDEVQIAAPSREFSGASAALTAVEKDGRILVEARELPGLSGVPTYSVAASPAFIVLIALHGGLGPVPDLVLSGINYGANAGRALTHSGTVGAALTAALDGRRGAAFSVGMTIRAPREPRWDTAGTVARELLPLVYALPPGVVLNVNVPSIPYEDLRGVRRAPLATFGAVQFTIVERDEGYVRMGLTDSDAELEEGTDESLLALGYVTVTPVRPAAEAGDVHLPLADVPLGMLSGSGYPGQST